MNFKLLYFLIFFYCNIYCQESFNSGGNIYIYSNEYSYSIGQTFSDFLITNSHHLTQGIQNPVFLEPSSILLKKEKVNIKITPNPTTDYLTIEFDTPNEREVRIYNNLGQLVFEKDLLFLFEVMQISNLPNSIYLFNVLQNNKLIFTTKIFKI
jgi:hypothetical protein